jgi:hypothetical protein
MKLAEAIPAVNMALRFNVLLQYAPSKKTFINPLFM